MAVVRLSLQQRVGRCTVRAHGRWGWARRWREWRADGGRVRAMAAIDTWKQGEGASRRRGEDGETGGGEVGPVLDDSLESLANFKGGEEGAVLIEEGLDLEEEQRGEEEVLRLRRHFTERRHEGIINLRERAALGAGHRNGVSEKEDDVGDVAEAAVMPEAFTVGVRDLKPGEYVVHERIGIGQFIGIFIHEHNEGEREVAILKFQDQMARLPVEKADNVLFRYFSHSGEGAAAPKLNRVKDTTAWKRRTNKARTSVQDMVVNVMNTYISRLSRVRPVYEIPDCSAFDVTFEYKLTDDQHKALADIERDLTSRDTPMDRLIIGDVGFGKTEVALRAVYRAVKAGKQVLVLSPTTVLAEQHFHVMSKRLNKFGITTALLARGIKAKDKREIKGRLEDGTLDVCIGTHALLSPTIQPCRLGMVVVDEEQKFGVKQKELLKNMRCGADIDVLTLSATPIPRTLHLSLSGFRDASLIVTPPPGRLPVDTVVSEYDESKVYEAINRELKRGGQVFYVTDRIQGMKDIYDKLSGMCPDARVSVVHGKLSAAAMEERMDALRTGEVNLMICTTIVESGVDVPNVNTVIVENTHMFGLATLYQIRGRVGRSRRQAYALFFWPETIDINADRYETIRQRLDALAQCKGLGEGFQLAERDMAIRGIGNVFGEKQSGHLDNVGSDYFVKILCEQLERIEKAYLPAVRFDDVNLRIPYSNVEMPLDFLASDEERTDFLHDLVDAARTGTLQKFLMYHYNKQSGNFPPAVQMYIKVVSVQKLASELGINAIDFTRNYVFQMSTQMPEAMWLILREATDAKGDSVIPKDVKSRLSFSEGQGIMLRPERTDCMPYEHLQALFTTLMLLKKCRPDFVKFMGKSTSTPSSSE